MSEFVFAHPGRSLVVPEVARTIEIAAGPDQIARAAAAAERERTLVVGALPFSPATPATLMVPARVESALPSAAASAPSPLRITPVPAPETYVAAVEKARAAIRAGDYDKVVLARMLVAQADHEFDRAALLARLRAVEPDAYVFRVRGFLGATPELLVARDGRRVRAQPLAGTAARGPEGADRRLLSSAKERHEHALVVDAVRAALAPVCDELTVSEPHVIATSTVWHLATTIEGTLREPAPSSLALAALLHPTPAVCGTPRDAAARAIGELEDIDRALYAGLVGWTDRDGNGEWAIALRCAEVAGRIALLFAGAGIVADSDPQSELEETEAKFRSMLGALGYA